LGTQSPYGLSWRFSDIACAVAHTLHSSVALPLLGALLGAPKPKMAAEGGEF